MACRDVLCIFESSKGELTPAFYQSLSLAIFQRAHLSVFVTARKVTPPGANFGGSLVADAIQKANQDLRDVAETAANAARNSARIAGIIHDIAVHEGMLNEIVEWAGQRARLADATVIDQTGAALLIQSALFEQILFSSGRPTIIASPNKISDRIERLCVAWNGTTVAARALGDALGLFPEISKVDIVCVVGAKSSAGRAPGVDAAKHVARHGAEANVVDLPLSEGSVAATINAYARTSGADLVVMGGYGHSRLREFILGGVTRELIATNAVALQLSH